MERSGGQREIMGGKIRDGRGGQREIMYGTIRGDREK